MRRKSALFLAGVLVGARLFAGGGQSASRAEANEAPPEVVKDLGVYDSSWDADEFCTLVIPAGVVVTTFNGGTVDWGLYQGSKVKVVIPAGSHTLMADYTHPAVLLDADGNPSAGFTAYDYYMQQQRMNQARSNMQSGNSATRSAGMVQGGLEILGSLFSLGAEAAAAKKEKARQAENEKRLAEAKSKSKENIEIYQRFAPGGMYELQVVPASSGAYNVQMTR